MTPRLAFIPFATLLLLVVMAAGPCGDAPIAADTTGVDVAEGAPPSAPGAPMEQAASPSSTKQGSTESKVTKGDQAPPEPVLPQVYVGKWKSSNAKPKKLLAADKAFEDKKYKTARDGYAAFVEASPESAFVPYAIITKAKCHYQLAEYDEALAALHGLIEAKPGLLWEARAKVSLSELYPSLPSNGYEKSGKVHYNQEIKDGKYIYLYQEHRTKSMVLLQESRLAYKALLAAPAAARGAAKGDDLALEAVEVDFALIAAVKQASWDHHDKVAPSPPIDPPDPEGPYDPTWTSREKLLYLYDEVVRLNQGRSDTAPEAWALFQKVLFLMQFPEQTPAEWLFAEAERQKAYLDEYKGVTDPPPFEPKRWTPPAIVDPMAIIDGLIESYPQDERIELFEATKGKVYEHRQEFAKAVKLYKAFLEAHPDSKWKDDVEKSIFDLTRTYLSVSTSTIHYPGKDIAVSTSTRNAEKVTVDVYEIGLYDLFVSSPVMNAPHAQFSSAYDLFYDFAGAKKYLHDKVASLTEPTKDKGDHAYSSVAVTIPELPVGTYLLHAHAGTVEQIHILVVTDIVIVGKSLGSGMEYFVADALTGKPLPNLPVIVKESWYDYDAWFSKDKTKHTKTKTDASGRLTYGFTKGSNISSNRVQVLAGKKERIAFTTSQYGSYWSPGSSDTTYKIFTVTDRPVYRPGDSIKLKHVVRTYKDGVNGVAKGATVQLRVTDPKGTTIWEATKTANAFGAVWGEVPLEEGAALGTYYLKAFVQGEEWRCYQSSSASVQVEEYKKPEFEVKVTPSKAFATDGDEIEATIEAKYYWGAPVADGTVKYKVFRKVFQHSYAPPTKWDWLFGKGFGVDGYSTGSYGNELITSGEGTTDAEGKLMVTLPKVEAKGSYDYTYMVTADVKDPSRRTITGSGTVVVTREPFFVYLVTDQGFATEGDTVELEVVARSPGDAPVSPSGTIKLMKLSYPIGKEPVATEIASAPLTLDAKGRAFHSFELPEEGQYRVEFAGTVGKGPEVKGTKVLTAIGDTFDNKLFRFSKVSLTSKKRYYTKGEAIEVLFSTPWKDATVWLTREGGSEVFWSDIITAEGGSHLMTFTATAEDQPNLFVRAIVVHEGQVHVVERELFVPPSDGILECTVTPSKPVFDPGTDGSFTVELKDALGKPVVGEVSLSVFDSSVLYIKGESGADIRSYYYGERRYLDIYPFHSADIYMSRFSHDSVDKHVFKLKGLPTPYGSFAFDASGGETFTCPSCKGDKLYRSSTISTMLDDESTIVDGVLATGAVSQTKYAANAPAAPAPGMAESAGADMPMEEDNGKDMGPMKADFKAGKKGKATGAQGPEVTVRTYFPDTALWIPDLVTGKDGKAQASLTWPDSLTTWAVRVVAADGTTKVGLAKATVITTKKLVARLETPRFMTEGDLVTLSAMVRNDHPEDLTVALTVSGGDGKVQLKGPSEATITVPAGTEVRHDFVAEALAPGNVEMTLKAVADKDSDALVKTFSVLEWGAETMYTQASVMRKPGTMTLSFTIPEDRKPETTMLTVVAEPSMAGGLLRALPYLIRYPYGCVEQTMSRFLPAVLVKKTLTDAGLSLSTIPAMAKEATLADPLSAGQIPPMPWWETPVYDDAKLAKLVKKGLDRLYDFQHSDGGWAWWKLGDSDPFMSAYVLMGLLEAKGAGEDVDQGVIDSGVEFLKGALADSTKKLGEARELEAYMGYTLSLAKAVTYADLKDAYDHRESMSPYGQALIAHTMHNIGEAAKAKAALDSLLELAWVDDTFGTASFKAPATGWWWWFNEKIETVAWTLKATMAIDPNNAIADKLALWLMKNRQGNQWSSTKSTALTIYALNAYMTHHEELTPTCTVTMAVNGVEKKQISFTKANVLAGGGSFVLSGEALGSGALDVTITSEGACSVYGNAFVSYFSTEESIPASGSEIAVERTYYKLIEKTLEKKGPGGKPIKVLDYDRVELKDGDPIKSGDLIEVAIEVDSPNDYEYLVFEDYKPAGCEPKALKSGGAFENGAWIYRELRDTKVVTFLYDLAQGKQTISYQLVAQIPGTFRVLPHQASAMYAPRIKANSASAVMVITD